MKCPKCGHSWAVKKGKKNQYLKYVFLEEEEYKKLVKRFTERGAIERIKTLDEAIAIHGYKYKDHYRVILKWASGEPKPSEASYSTPEERQKVEDDFRSGKTINLNQAMTKVVADIKKKKNGGR